MVRRMTMAFTAAIAACLLLSAQAEEKTAADKPEAEKKFTATCPVSGQPAKEAQFTAYKEGQTYFCCEKCKAAFEQDSTKHAVKANAQLVQTKQYKQVKCPFSGGDLNKDTAIKVGKTKVAFCCEKCQAKAEAAADDEQLAMIYADAPFEKGFEKKASKKERKADSGS